MLKQAMGLIVMTLETRWQDRANVVFGIGLILDLVTRGGFPQLLLAPINFEAHYAQAVGQRDAAATSVQATH